MLSGIQHGVLIRWGLVTLCGICFVYQVPATLCCFYLQQKYKFSIDFFSFCVLPVLTMCCYFNVEWFLSNFYIDNCCIKKILTQKNLKILWVFVPIQLTEMFTFHPWYDHSHNVYRNYLYILLVYVTFSD